MLGSSFMVTGVSQLPSEHAINAVRSCAWPQKGLGASVDRQACQEARARGFEVDRRGRMVGHLRPAAAAGTETPEPLQRSLQRSLSRSPPDDAKQPRHHGLGVIQASEGAGKSTPARKEGKSYPNPVTNAVCVEDTYNSRVYRRQGGKACQKGRVLNEKLPSTHM